MKKSPDVGCFYSPSHHSLNRSPVCPHTYWQNFNTGYARTWSFIETRNTWRWDKFLSPWTWRLMIYRSIH
jgi:hypothetical protein